MHIPERNLEFSKYLQSKRAASRNLVKINKWQQVMIISSDIARKTKNCRG